MSPLEALSSLSAVQLPTNANALGGAANGALNGQLGGQFTGALNGALQSGFNTAPLPGSTPVGLSAPINEGFGQLLQNAPNVQGLQAVQPTPLSGGASPSTWGHMVQQMVREVNSKQHDASALVTDVLKGGPTPVHQAMIASEEASLSFQFLAEVRNKVLDAYNQVMQMQV